MDGENFFKSVLEVRTYECDSYGHVNNAVYLNYLEFARVELLKSAGLTLDQLLHEGIQIVIGRIDIRYKCSARAGDILQIKTRAKSMRTTSGVFCQTILNEKNGKLIAEAEILWVTTDKNGVPHEIPEAIKTAFSKFA